MPVNRISTKAMEKIISGGLNDVDKTTVVVKFYSNGCHFCHALSEYFVGISDEDDFQEQEYEGEFTPNKFNSAFDNYKDTISKSKKSTSMSLREPDELISYKDQDSLSILGRGKVKNYSGSVNGLGYRDLKDAFENPTLINVNQINISDRETDIMYYEKKRENISHNMSETDLLRYKEQINKSAQQEKRRLNRLQREDLRIEDTYNKIHQRMLN